MGLGHGHQQWQLSPVLTPLLVGVRNEVALGLSVVVVLGWREDEGWQITCGDKDRNLLLLTAPLHTGETALALSSCSQWPLWPHWGRQNRPPSMQVGR